jgi:NNP family nitrate/nitrite transporter-like MFS transporter
MLMFILVAVSLIWMHVAIRRQEHRKFPTLADEKFLSDLPETPIPATAAR